MIVEKNVHNTQKVKFVYRRNILETTELSKCHYHPDNDPFCPIISIQEILDMAEPDPKYQDTLFEIVNFTHRP